MEEGAELIEEKPVAAVLDAGLIAAAQRVEHYEIAAYGTLRGFAQTLGHTKIVGLLDKTLKDEKDADTLLSNLATSGINEGALAPEDE